MSRIEIFLLVLISACQQKTPEQRLKSYVDDPDNKITQAISIGNTGIVTKFLPASYRTLVAGRSDTAFNNDDGFCYFNVRIDRKAGEKPSREQLLYLNFDIENNFVLLVNNRDSLAPAICQKIENGIAGSYEYMVAFEKKENEKWDDFTLIYHDKIFSIGTVAFVYKVKDILKIPGIKDKKQK
jgi:hypothetical protein